MQEGSCDVTLLGLEIEQNFQYQEKPNSSPLNHRGIRLKEIDAFNLLVTSSTETSFEFLDETIWKTYTFETQVEARTFIVTSYSTTSQAFIFSEFQLQYKLLPNTHQQKDHA